MSVTRRPLCVHVMYLLNDPTLDNENRVLYIHCFGGHGRSGLVMAILLQHILNLNKDGAMDLLQRSHQKRGCQYCKLSKGKLESVSQEVQAGRLGTLMSNRQ